MHSPRPVAQKLQHEGKPVDGFNGFAQGLFVDEPTALFHGQTESLLNFIGGQRAQLEPLSPAQNDVLFPLRSELI